MSDPMTNIEIEDVLSSIRRLVAEVPADKPAAPAATARPMPKLVLTPALRVDAPATEAEPAPVMLDESQRVDAASTWSDLTVDDSLRAQGDAPSDRASLLATIAELEAAVRAQPGEWEPDGTGTDTDLSWARAGFPGDVEVEDAEELPPRPAPASTSAWPRTLAEAARRYGEEGAAEADEDPQPEFRHHRSAHVTRPDAEDGDFHDDLIGGPDLGDDPEDMLESYLAGAPLIDEAQLREMVRDILRQELQGKLGERITRNVRKMVRREIHRALTTPSFD